MSDSAAKAPRKRQANGPDIITMGCRLNIAESEAIRAGLQQSGQDGSNLIIINSCAVTNEAVRQTRQSIRRARKANPDAKLVVTGCAAQIDPDSFSAMAQVDRVVGNIEKYDPASFAFAKNELHNGPSTSPHVQDIMRIKDTAPHMASAFTEHARAFVEVQNGCDHRCTFCIIPYGRGNSRSVPAGKLVDHIQSLVDRGYKEVVLTGVDVTSYGHDLPGQPNLGMLVERIMKLVPDLPRLRLSSLDGIEVDDRLFDLLTGETRIMPHIHISLQSGDDMILKRMKRRHNRGQAINLVERLKAKRPEIAIGADLIAGFPTEDDAMHRNNLSIIAACDIVHAHIFPFSPRDGTPAARMPQLDRAVIKERAREMRVEAAKTLSAWQTTLLGKTGQMLVEKSGLQGHLENFAKVRLSSPAPAGQLLDVTINDIEDRQLMATACGHKTPAKMTDTL
jgi:threonylcarbamoyladenosine tRNA methylthiotransferase MtaB